ncbi:unnamed protein product, partial [Scytosiphon promiscuus]
RRETLRGEGEQVLDVIAETCTLKEWAALLKVPLERAMAQGDEALADKLIRAGAEIGTSLHAAVRGDHGKIVELMLESGASTRTKDAKGRTALHFAARLDRLEMARLLLLKGADKDAVQINGATPLHSAARHGSANAAETLLIAGADVNLRLKWDGLCPLDRAAEFGHSEVMKILIYSGANINSCIPKSGKTALDTAAGEENNAKAVDVLLDAGANIEARDSKGHTPLHTAAIFARSDSARSLLERGADVNALTLSGASTLILAAPFAGDGRTTKVVDLLLRYGADETVTDKLSRRAADVVGLNVEEGIRLADEVELVRKLLSNAPADRAWRRRGLPVLCRAYPGRVRTFTAKGSNTHVGISRMTTETDKQRDAGSAPEVGGEGRETLRGEGERVLDLVEEGIFRNVVGYL